MNDIAKTQDDSTLYMPSMYDSEEEEDARDENTCSEIQRSEPRRRHSRYSLMRCLAWSEAEDDIEEKKSSNGKEDQVDEDQQMFVIQNNSVGCISFNSVHSAHIDSIHRPSGNEIRPVHWIQRVSSDNKIDSYLSGKKENDAFSKC
ncbi:unnamed protein product [Pseudo-nitzschia multistriata]|uniref:Uncharacterized protein n=1 Tax=Pseudo-nitzschia multistriata TaxID=183589 RepID=A0A448Z8Z7_9STRA|nr:unnamed protein product [Pseudo-nitzschia multistriata]